jgi:hypothetical protein
MNPNPNAIVTLIRKDLRWVGPLGLLGLLGNLVSMAVDGAGPLWVYPEGDWGIINITYFATAATVMGLAAVLAEEITRTREYLLHRPQSPARIFWTRQGLVLAVLALWVVATPTLHLLGSELFYNDAVLIDESRLGLRMIEGLPSFLFYGLAVFCVSVSRTVWGGALLTLAAGLAALGFVLASVVVDVSSRGGLAVGLTTLLGTPLLLAAAQRCQRQGRDADRPWSGGRLRLAGIPLLLVAAVTAAASLTLIHGGAAAGLHELYPDVGQHGGRYLLRRWNGDPGYREIDRQTHRGGPQLPDEGRVLPGPEDGPWSELPAYFDQSFPGRGDWFRGQLHAQSYGPGKRRTYFSSDGYVRIYQRVDRNPDRRWERPWMRTVGRGPENRPFSPRTWILSAPYDRVAVFLDRSDDTLWTYDLSSSAPHFVRQELPGGDRFREVDPEQSILRLHRASFAQMVVLGERGRYVLTPEGWQPAPARPDAAPAEERVRRRVRYERAGRFHLTLIGADGREIFHHYFRPRTLGERATEILIEGPTVLRPGVTLLASLLSSPARAYQPASLLFLDPAVALGSRAPLAGGLALTLLLAAFTFLRLRRLGLPSGRQAFWIAAVLLGGFPAYLCGRLVETERAWRPLARPAEPQPTPARLLLTA